MRIVASASRYIDNIQALHDDALKQCEINRFAIGVTKLQMTPKESVSGTDAVLTTSTRFTIDAFLKCRSVLLCRQETQPIESLLPLIDEVKLIDALYDLRIVRCLRVADSTQDEQERCHPLLTIDYQEGRHIAGSKRTGREDEAAEEVT